jgi:hypothetical protein
MSGMFSARARDGFLGKRPCTDANIELGAEFDLIRDFPLITIPVKSVLDPGKVRTLLGAASAISTVVVPVLNGPNSLLEVKESQQ